MPKILVAFDFDHTIIDDNSDLYVIKLAENGRLPDHIKALYSDNGWTEYMGAIFRYLHENGTTREDMLNCVGEIPLTDHFMELFNYLQKWKEIFEVIIISDSNSVFISHILQLSNLNSIAREVYTNPAEFTSTGCLKVKYYHTQTTCDLSTINLCKGQILQEHIKARQEQGVDFDVIAYVGDGSNDLCPSLRLGPGDLVFPRTGYSLSKKVAKLDEGAMKAEVHQWKTGHTILDVLQSKL